MWKKVLGSFLFFFLALAGSVSVALAEPPFFPGPMTVAGCGVTTVSAKCLAAGTVTSHLEIQNVTSGTTNYVACTWNGTAVLNDKSSFLLAPNGGNAQWGVATSVVPTTELDCIATANTAQLYIGYQ